MFNLSDIHFAQKDASIIEQEIIKRFEASWLEATGEPLTLYPGDPRRLLLLTVADELIQQRYNIDFAAKMNLLAYSVGDYLDHLAVHVGVDRLPAQAAITTIRFTLSVIQPGVIVIPMGTRVTAGDQVYFATTQTVEIPAGQIYIDAPARCIEAGNVGNGYVPGQIKKLVDPLPWIQSVENITVSAGGADVEDDENLRERTQLAPESFTVAGSRGSYISRVKEASQLICDVSVYSPDPGIVDIYPLLDGGLVPGQEILDDVYSICNAETVRPLTDFVRVYPPTEVGYTLEITWYLDRAKTTMAVAIETAVNTAVQEWVLWQRSKLGRDVNPSELIRRVMTAGAKRVDVKSPAYQRIEHNQLAVAINTKINYGGIEDG